MNHDFTSTLKLIEAALREWSERPDMKCMDCGRLKFTTTAFQVGYGKEGWSVSGFSSLQTPDLSHWVQLEEHVDAGSNSSKIQLRQLCPACRKTHNL